MNFRESIIYNYIDGYNTMDIDKMVAHFADNIKFENVQHGEVNLRLQGLEAFKQQAALAKGYFITRQQRVKSIKHLHNKTEIEVDYNAVLAVDLPNGLRRGQSLQLAGKSVFKFAGNKVIRLTDIS